MFIAQREAVVEDDVKIDEAAAILGVSPWTIHLWIKKGHFPGAYKMNPFTKRGSPWLIPMEDIKAFIAARKG